MAPVIAKGFVFCVTLIDDDGGVEGGASLSLWQISGALRLRPAFTLCWEALIGLKFPGLSEKAPNQPQMDVSLGGQVIVGFRPATLFGVNSWCPGVVGQREGGQAEGKS